MAFRDFMRVTRRRRPGNSAGPVTEQPLRVPHGDVAAVEPERVDQRSRRIAGSGRSVRFAGRRSHLVKNGPDARSGVAR
jgi:hypothetical protein